MAGGTPELLPRSETGRSIVRWGLVAWAVVGIGLVVVGAYIALRPLRWVIVALGIGAIVTLLLEPGVRALEHRRVPRYAAAPVLVLAVLVPLLGGLWFLGTIVVEEAGQLVEDAPELATRVERFLDDMSRQIDDAGLGEAADPDAWSSRAEDVVGRLGESALGIATTAGALVAATVLGVVIALYALLTLPKLRENVRSMAPDHRQDDVLEGLRIVGDSFGAFLRGQLVVAVIVGVVSGVGLWVLDVPSPVLLGVIVGVLDLVPFFGPVVGTALGMALAFAAGGIWLALAVLVLFIVIQQLEGAVLSPLVLGKTVHLPALTVLVAVAAGAALAGVIGMILAVPTIAAIRGLWQRFGTSGSPA